MPTKHRVLLCRLGFVLSCLLPTALTGAWIASRLQRPLAALATSDVERELKSRFGLVVEIDEVSSVSTSEMRLGGVRLLDPETRAVLVQAAAVEGQHNGLGWRINATGAEVNASQLRRLCATLHDRLLCGPTGEMPIGTLAARDVILRTDQHVQTLATLNLELNSHAIGPQIAAQCSLAGLAPSDQPLSITIARDRGQSPPLSRVQLDTDRQSVPCALLAVLLPDAARLGSEARFSGTVSGAFANTTGWSGEIAGTFDDIDLDALVTEHFPHQLSGLGRLQIDRATIDGGRLVELRGTLDVGSGSLSSSLLVAAVEHLGLKSANPKDPLPTADTIPFQRLAMGFQLDGRLLRIRGLAHASTGRVLVKANGVPLLVAATDHGVPAVNLLRVLLPDNQFLVPATRQTEALIGFLPVPELIPERTAAKTTHTPTRLRSSGPADAAPVLRQPEWR